MKIRPAKIFILFSIFCIFFSAIFFFVKNKFISKKVTIIAKALNSNAKISIKDMRQIFTKGDRKELLLFAKMANYFNKKNRVDLEGVKATFFTENGGKVFLSCKEAFMDTQTKDLEATGSVKLDYEKNKFRSEKLFYYGKREIFFSNSEPVFLGENFKVTSEKFTI